MPALQHSDRLVRVAAASLVFNVSARVQKVRAAKVREEKDEVDWIFLDEKWEVQLVQAGTEALAKEEESEDLGEVPFTNIKTKQELPFSLHSRAMRGSARKLTVRAVEIRELVMEVAADYAAHDDLMWVSYGPAVSLSWA